MSTRYFSRVSVKWKEDIQENVVQGTLTTLALRGLRPVTTYIVRIRAENSLGPGEFSQEIQVTTDEEGKFEWSARQSEFTHSGFETS